MTATMDEAADLASAASPRLHCGLRQSIDAVSSADMEFQNLWSCLVSSPLPSCQNSQHRGTMAAGTPCHIPMRPLPPETSDHPAAL